MLDQIIQKLYKVVDENFRTLTLADIMEMTFNEWKAANLPFAMLDHIRVQILTDYIINCAVYKEIPVTGYNDKMEGEP